MCRKHVGGYQALGKCCTIIFRLNWCNQSTMVLRTCNVSCVSRWCDGFFLAVYIYWPLPHCLPPLHWVQNASSRAGGAGRGTQPWLWQKTTDLDPKVTPLRNPLELTCPGNWTSVIVSEEFPSIVHKCRSWKTGPTHGRLHQKKVARGPAANKDELQFRRCYRKGYLFPEGLTW